MWCMLASLNTTKRRQHHLSFSTTSIATMIISKDEYLISLQIELL